MKIQPWQLKQRQGCPLEIKEQMTDNRIRAYYQAMQGQVYVSFSGGKDSTVLLDLVRKLYPEVPAVFVDTGLEYSEIRDFVKTIENVIWLKPKMPFNQVIDKYGYPVVSKDQARAISRYRNTSDPVQKYRGLNGWPNGKKGMISKKWQFLVDAPFKISDACCDIMKKQPLDHYAKKSGRRPIIGTMAGESNGRTRQYLEHGCIKLREGKEKCMPVSFWLEKDVWDYIHKYNLPYSKIYDMGYTRTGCMFCMFGLHLEGHLNRFELMAQTHPQLYKYCMEKLGLAEVINFVANKG